MKKHLMAGAAAALVMAGWVSGAQAQVRTRETVTESGPNRALLSSGLFALGVPYVTSVIVAAQSDYSPDKHLYLPVVGPWIDLGDRGSCGGIAQPSCNGETGYKALLVVDGIVQGIGALEIVGAFVFPETRSVSLAGADVIVSPARMGRDGYGLSAVGVF